ncbi:MAG: ATP-binding protein [Deltaproteobacteria bacterium]|uniref:ATP-binding protein n=1 Tax=Candidatus Zymogenus saltonus TaxID=2844893 RepID=A0A9D8KF94_9DELT|nr:ATP-binding protein [Candidatus Zymogenus saltonus]
MSLNHFENILRRGYESKELDYKSPIKWDEKDKKASCEIVKDILAMANTNGGWIVIGVKEIDNGFDFIGVTKEESKSFESTRVNNFVQKYADPPINLKVVKIESENRDFVILEIPQFLTTPHICIKNYPDVLLSATLYVRTDNNESAPINSSHDLRNILELSIKNRSEQLLEQISIFFKHGEMGERKNTDQQKFEEQINDALKSFDQNNTFKDEYYGYREVWLVPEKFDEILIEKDNLLDISKKADIDYIGRPFLQINYPNTTCKMGNNLQTFNTYQDFLGNKRVYFWRLYQSGLFIKKENIYEFLKTDKETKVLDIDITTLLIAASIFFLTKLYCDVLDETDFIELNIVLRNTLDRKLCTGENVDDLSADYFSKMPEIHYKKSLRLLEWNIGKIENALEIAESIFKDFHWDQPNLEPVKRRLKLEKIFQRDL